MLITYIVILTREGNFLPRCIESLYSQKDKDFEIIIADDDTGYAEAYVQEQLTKRDNLKIITKTDEEGKMAAAFQLIDETSQFVQLLEETTFVVPFSLENLRKNAAADDMLILPNVVMKKGSEFIKIYDDDVEKLELSGGLNAFSYCYRKNLFDRYQEHLFKDPYNIESVLDELFSNGIKRKFVEPICYYINDSIMKKKSAYSENYECINKIAENIANNDIGWCQVYLYTKYIHRLMGIICSADENQDEKIKAYGSLKQFGKTSSDNYALKKIFLLNIGIPYKDIENLDLHGFLTLHNEYIQCTEAGNIATVVSSSVEKASLSNSKRLSSIESDISSINLDNKTVTDVLSKKLTALDSDINSIRQILEKKEVISGVTEESMRAILEKQSSNSDEVNSIISMNNDSNTEIKKVHEDIIALTTNMHFLMQKIENGQADTSKVSGFIEPVNEVPYLFATGKLGFKVIIRCINCWFRYKFSRKKK